MALVSEKTLFIHLPKTGGSSVRAMMAAAGIKTWESGPFEIEDHYGIPEILATHPEICDGRKVFSCVRHPVSWIKSRWAYGMASGFADKVHTNPAAAAHWMACCWSNDFRKFVENYLERMPGVYSQMICAKLAVWDFPAPVVAVLRTEKLVDHLVTFLSVSGHTFDEAALRSVPPQKVAANALEYQAKTVIPSTLEHDICHAEDTMMTMFDYWNVK